MEEPAEAGEEGDLSHLMPTTPLPDPQRNDLEVFLSSSEERTPVLAVRIFESVYKVTDYKTTDPDVVKDLLFWIEKTNGEAASAADSE